LLTACAHRPIAQIVDSSRIVASEFVTISDGAYTTAQIKETELAVLRTLDFDVFQAWRALTSTHNYSEYSNSLPIF
jgi:hypothetical protein